VTVTVTALQPAAEQTNLATPFVTSMLFSRSSNATDWTLLQFEVVKAKPFPT
jgi:hypothetical protein